MRNIWFSLSHTAFVLLPVNQEQNAHLFLVHAALGLSPSRLLRPFLIVDAGAAVLINAGYVVFYVFYKGIVSIALMKKNALVCGPHQELGLSPRKRPHLPFSSLNKI